MFCFACRCIERVQNGFTSSIVVAEKFDFKDNEFAFTRRIQYFTKSNLGPANINIFCITQDADLMNFVGRIR